MNRTEYLHESIQTWNELEELNEIVVVDYSSEKPILQSDLPKPKFGKKNNFGKSKQREEVGVESRI